MAASGSGAGGVFLDGTHWQHLVGCKLRTCGEAQVMSCRAGHGHRWMDGWTWPWMTRSQDECCHFTEEEELDYNTGIQQAVLKLGEGIHALDPR